MTKSVLAQISFSLAPVTVAPFESFRSALSGNANPFFYVILGFRHGFLGASDSSLLVGAIGMLAINILLYAACYALIRSGWKIKA